MSTNLNYKQVANFTRRTWDVEAYEKKAKEREKAAEEGGDDARRKRGTGQPEEDKEEFKPAASGAAGPEGSKRAFLKAREGQVDIDSRVGTSEIVSIEVAAGAASSSQESNGCVKTGVGWHCRVCDCFLKDSLTYLDHINGRKHQRKLGYTMRVERSTKDDLVGKLEQLAKKKEEEERMAALSESAISYEDIVKAKDAEAKQRQEERRQKRQERKKLATQQVQQELDDEEEEQVEAAVDPSLAAMMGFSGFGGGSK